MNVATRTLPFFFGLLLLSGHPHLLGEENGAGQITVFADQPTVTLPATLYGLFYEDINYSGDGGLYAELIQNRSFEYYPVQGQNPRKDDFHPLYAWEKVEGGDGACEMLVESKDPLNANNTKYVRLKIEESGDGVGVANQGFDGISIVRGETYDFSFYAKRSASFDAPVRVLLQGENGNLGQATIRRLSAEWTKYEVSLVATSTDEKARLVLLTTGEGDLFMDMISLFPRKTFKGRKNGLRADLAQALAELKPAMFRFPGGCIAHGQGLDNAYRWKDTIGDVAERKPNWNLWGYHQTYGLGYFEYFQLCEDIGAEPLPILPVGVSCGFRKPFENEKMSQLQDWVDDAIDLIEFANGPVDSTWGRIRAEMGHPEPFHLKYIGLGNEDHHTAEFEERFPYFVGAIRAKAPHIKIVGTSGLGHQIPIYQFMAEQKVDLSDEHYYEAPEWFINNQKRFDDFERSGPKVFVGEYASRGNRLFNAVAEAAFLTGIERNADIVHMTAYAPLLARYGFTQWQAANLIWFDHKTVVRTPSYYVQQLFSLNKGDRYLKNDSSFHLNPPEAANPAIGNVGVGTWSTAAEFDDLRVQSGSTILIDEDFSDDAEGWTVASGKYATQNGAYVQSAVNETPAMSICRTKVKTSNVVYSLAQRKRPARKDFSFCLAAVTRVTIGGISAVGETHSTGLKGEAVATSAASPSSHRAEEASRTMCGTTYVSKSPPEGSSAF